MVYLVGAGAGNAELITLKGIECIKTADVIIFDNLINISLLNLANDDCRLIYAGKVSGNHHLAQEETNALLVKYAREGKTVVRLKGGDPTVFGRGGEEAQYLCSNGIPFELVPGVSSCYSAAEYAGISVTHRGAASSFHVITGHEKNEHIDYAALAGEEGTLIFMMGLKNLPKIAEKLIKNGKNPHSPAAAVSNGTLQNQQCVTGTLGDIAQKAASLPFPAVIIVGDVITKRCEWFTNESRLKNVKIVSTATKAVSADLAKEAKKRGGCVTEISLIKTAPINFDKFKNTRLSDFTHIVFSSVNGVDIFFSYLCRLKTDIRALSGIKIAAVGEKTAAALTKRGIYADFIPEKHSGESLALLLEGNLKPGDNVLLLRAQAASEAIPEMLRRNEISFTDLPIYKTETNFEKSEAAALAVKDADYVIFSSGSAAKAFLELIGKSENIKFISIGQQTTKAAEELGFKIYKTAAEPTAKSVIECIEEDVR